MVGQTCHEKHGLGHYVRIDHMFIFAGGSHDGSYHHDGKKNSDGNYSPVDFVPGDKNHPHLVPGGKCLKGSLQKTQQVKYKLLKNHNQ